MATTIDPPSPTVDIRRIVGRTEELGSITLDGCFEVNEQVQIVGQGISTSTVRADLSIVGVHYDREEEIAFSKVSVVVEGLNDWVGITGIKANRQTNSDTILLSISQPQTIPFGGLDGVDLELEFPIEFDPVGLPVTEIRVKQYVRINFIAEQPRPIKFFADLWVKICHFISLATDEPVTVQAISAVPVNHKDGALRRVHEVDFAR